MTTALLGCACLELVGIVAWRPHGWGPAVAAAVAVGFAMAAGMVAHDDVTTALSAQWRAFATLASVMIMTSTAESMGWLDRLAEFIEPRTRGPVRYAFRVTFIISAAVAAVLSNDAAILVLTPTVIALLRTVYPKRHPKFLLPFVVAVFAAAGVAPLVVSNPMNLIFAEHVGIGFNEYSAVMIPVALIGWVTTYGVLAWMFRDVLADDAPALGAWPARPPAPRGAKVILATVSVVLLAYPLVSLAQAPLWPVAVAGAVVCSLTCIVAGQPWRNITNGIAWSIFPFLVGVFVLALALERSGVVLWLQQLYSNSTAPLATVGATAAVGSAVLNNHPMSVLNAFALNSNHAPHGQAFAALIGGDLGPRLLPVGSLASLLWYDALRKHKLDVPVSRFVKIGVLITIPTMIVSLLLLWVWLAVIGYH